MMAASTGKQHCCFAKRTRIRVGSLKVLVLCTHAIFLGVVACQPSVVVMSSSVTEANATAPSPTIFTEAVGPSGSTERLLQTPAPAPAPLAPAPATVASAALAPAPATVAPAPLTPAPAPASYTHPAPAPPTPPAPAPVPPHVDPSSSSCSSGCIAANANLQFSKDVPNTGIVVGSIVGIMLFAALLGFLLLRHRHVSEGTPKAHPSSNSSTKHSSSAAVVSTNPGRTSTPEGDAGKSFALSPGVRVCCRSATGGQPGYVAPSYARGDHVPVKLDNGQQLLVLQSNVARLFDPNEKVLYIDPISHGTRVATVAQAEGRHWPPFYSIRFANEAGLLETVQQQLQPLPPKTI